MKKFICGLLVGLMISISTLAFAGSNPIKLIINGQEIKTDVPPQVIEGRVLVPARYIADNLGATVNWDNANKSVIITSNNQLTQSENMSIDEIYKIIDDNSKLTMDDISSLKCVKGYVVDDKYADIWNSLSNTSKKSYLQSKLNEIKKEYPDREIFAWALVTNNGLQLGSIAHDISTKNTIIRIDGVKQ